MLRVPLPREGILKRWVALSQPAIFPCHLCPQVLGTGPRASRCRKKHLRALPQDAHRPENLYLKVLLWIRGKLLLRSIQSS